jgi:hypothetical protein
MPGLSPWQVVMLERRGALWFVALIQVAIVFMVSVFLFAERVASKQPGGWHELVWLVVLIALPPFARYLVEPGGLINGGTVDERLAWSGLLGFWFVLLIPAVQVGTAVVLGGLFNGLAQSCLSGLQC